VSKAPVSLMDIPHTICLLAGINVTGGGGADDVTMGELGPNGINFGQSLVPALKGTEGDMARFVYSEGGFFFANELFPGGSDHVGPSPKGMYWPRAQVYETLHRL